MKVAIILEHGRVRSVWCSAEMAKAYIDDAPGEFHRPEIIEKDICMGFMRADEDEVLAT